MFLSSCMQTYYCIFLDIVCFCATNNNNNNNNDNLIYL
jgi:hypothetical protein